MASDTFRQTCFNLIFNLTPFYSESLDKANRLYLLKKWIQLHRDAPELPTRDSYFQHIAKDVLANSAITFLEFGVYRGASLKRWAELNTHTNSVFVGFDSFEGLPSQWGPMRQGHFSTKGQTPEFKDPRIKVVKGVFQDTLADFLRSFSPSHRLVVHADCDLYSSTLYVLTMLRDHLKRGSILMLDDFSTVLHQFRALMDFCDSHARVYRAIARSGLSAQHVAIEF
jgi:O-methyltransferase